MYEMLIVDDEEMSRESLATYFPWEEYGFHISGQAADGKEALEFLEGHAVHVVLTDISMPVMNGIELAEELQKKPDHPCIVFLSAYDDFHYAQDAIRYGVRFYILKPSGFQEIRETFTRIRQELDKKYHVSDLLPDLKDEDAVIEKVKEYIAKEYRTGTLTELSGKLFRNPSYLSQLIKLKTGKNFSDLLLEARMEQACIFLQDPECKIYNISSMVGYVNPNNFTRAFRNYFGQSPKEYRFSHKGELK
jgi:two-component system response regulator YesN